jgi:hypothetical protein
MGYPERMTRLACISLVSAALGGGSAASDCASTPLAAPRFALLMERADEHRVQLLLGIVDETTDPPSLRRASCRADSMYFYPASTIKLFAAIGALLRIQELQGEGVAVTADTPMVFHPMFDGETLDARDASNTAGGAITVAHEIRKLFVVSDNRAFNRLLGFVGRDDLNRMMWDAGLASVRIAHRLAIGYSAEQNRRMPRVEFLLPDGSRHEIPPRTARIELDNLRVPGLLVGEAEMVGGERRERPKSFDRSNRVSLLDLQDGLIMVVRPDVDLGKPGFDLSDAHRDLLIEAMGMLPRESTNPVYDTEKYTDDWAKFTLPGVERVLPGGRVRLLNKIGLAYGFTSITTGYSVEGRPPSVFVAGSIYTNANATLNDNVYEYDRVAMPFWADIGEVIAREHLLPTAQGSPGAEGPGRHSP